MDEICRIHHFCHCNHSLIKKLIYDAYFLSHYMLNMAKKLTMKSGATTSESKCAKMCWLKEQVWINSSTSQFSLLKYAIRQAFKLLLIELWPSKNDYFSFEDHFLGSIRACGSGDRALKIIHFEEQLMYCNWAKKWFGDSYSLRSVNICIIAFFRTVTRWFLASYNQAVTGFISTFTINSLILLK